MDMPSEVQLEAQPETQAREVSLEMVNDLGRHINTMAITLLAACVYIGIAVASTTHESILLDTPVEIPLFDINSIPLNRFYVFAPVLLVFLHVHLLLLETLLATKIEHVPLDYTSDGSAVHFFPSLPVNFLLAWKSDLILKIIFLTLFFLINMGLPLGLLLWAQVQFLVGRKVEITTLHQVLFVFDAALTWWFLRKIHKVRARTMRAEEVRPSRGISQFGRAVWSHLGTIVISVAIFFSVGIAVVPGTSVEAILGRALPMSSWLPRNPTYAGLDMREKDFRGLDLSYADFRDAVLVGSDFRGSILRGANFTNADLRRAKFGPVGGFGDRLISANEGDKVAMILEARRDRRRFRPAILDEAVLEGASLRYAHLELVSLRHASLRRADLTGAQAGGADLAYAELAEAQLILTDLSLAQLNFVTAQGANLTGSGLKQAAFNGADFRGVTAWGADFSNGVGNGARFVEARLEGANFRSARVFGALFRNSTVQGVTGLWPVAISLRGAAVAGLLLCQDFSAPPPFLTDLREIRPGLKSREDWDLIYNYIAGFPEGALRNSAIEKIASARDRPAPPCFGDNLSAEISPARLRNVVASMDRSAPEGWANIVRARSNFYYDVQRKRSLIGWPPSREQNVTGGPWDERAYYTELAAFLVELARASSKEGDGGFLESLRKTAGGEYSPSDPIFEPLLKAQLEAIK